MQKHTHPPETEKLADMGIGRGEFISMVAGLMALNALAIDIVLPAFPNIAANYAIDINAVQYVLLSYILGFGVAQLFFGPISDRFGRRIPLFVGLAVYIVAALAGALAPSFAALLVFRVIQGIGASATRVIALALVRDTHTGSVMASTMALVMMVFMTIPIIAPIVGQAIILFVSWHYIFGFMMLLALVMTVWSGFRLRETLDPENRRPLKARSIIGGFHLVLSNRISRLYTLSGAFFFGTMFAFFSTAQPIFADVYGLGNYFPIAFSATASLMALASYTSSRIVGRVGMRRLSHGALVTHFALTSLGTVIFFIGPAPLWVFMILMGLIMPLFGLIAANFNSIAMEPLGKVAGTASSVLGFTQMVGGGLIGTAIGQAYDGTVFPLIAGMAMISLASLILVLFAEKGRLFANPDA